MADHRPLPWTGTPWPLFAKRLAALHVLRDDPDPALELVSLSELVAQARSLDAITAYLESEELLLFAPSASALLADEERPIFELLNADDILVLADQGADTTARLFAGELDLRYEYVVTDEVADPRMRVRAAVLSDSLAVVHWLFGNSWFGQGL